MITDTEIDQKFDELEQSEAYGRNWTEYERYLSELDEETKETWLPIIYGAMMGEPLRDFLIRFDWRKPEGQEMIVPPCGEMPQSVMLVCYHAKRLAPEVISSILPSNPKKVYSDQRKKLLYGSDALSIIEMFEVDL